MGTMLRLTTGAVLPAAGQHVLKAADVAILLEAQAVLNAAHEQAGRIARDAEAVYEERREQGYLDGKAEGKLEHAEKMLETVMSSVEFIENIEDKLVNVVSQATRKIIGDLDDNERIVRIVRTALTTVRNHQHVTIRVAPGDADAVGKALSGLLPTTSGRSSFLDLIPDARLERGSCLLESELGVVDASLETQLKALENAFQAKIKP